ncbi:ribosomal protein L18 [delta proteobacterium NaphS2]|nr:ribosomal protein L18 [delta proteobacterium NaphS2]
MGAESSGNRRIKRKMRVRKRVKGSSERPRLCVFRSAKHIYAQLIDDTKGQTLVAVSSLSKDLASDIAGNGGNKKGAAVVGKAIGAAALAKGIKRISFDRNGFLYHGRVESLSKAARESGLQF